MEEIWLGRPPPGPPGPVTGCWIRARPGEWAGSPQALQVSVCLSCGHGSPEGAKFSAQSVVPRWLRLSTLAGRLAEALFAQGRIEEAQQISEHAQAAAPPSDIDAHARWRAARAKVLARSGQFPPRGPCWTRRRH